MQKTINFPITKITDKNLIDRGVKLFSRDVSFIKGVVEISGLPLEDRIEICFSGRSNVGKSSLINALAGRKSLARISNRPGRTQEINYFSLGSNNYLVDLPGYGYARAPINKIEKWQNLIRSYLMIRTSLRRVFLLIDSRHGVKPPDKEFMNLLDKAAVTFQIVLTKSDKISTEELQKALEITRSHLHLHATAYPEILITSSVKKSGVDFLKATIADIS